MSGLVLQVNDESFNSEVKTISNKPVFVDFWAPWCGPCRMLSPLIEAAATDYAEEAVFLKYNVDESNAVATENGIRGIPTLLVYKNGELVGQHTGGMSKSQLESFIEQYL